MACAQASMTGTAASTATARALSRRGRTSLPRTLCRCVAKRPCWALLSLSLSVHVLVLATASACATHDARCTCSYLATARTATACALLLTSVARVRVVPPCLYAACCLPDSMLPRQVAFHRPPAGDYPLPWFPMHATLHIQANGSLPEGSSAEDGAPMRPTTVRESRGQLHYLTPVHALLSLATSVASREHCAALCPGAGGSGCAAANHGALVCSRGGGGLAI